MKYKDILAKITEKAKPLIAECSFLNEYRIDTFRATQAAEATNRAQLQGNAIRESTQATSEAIDNKPLQKKSTMTKHIKKVVEDTLNKKTLTKSQKNNKQRRERLKRLKEEAAAATLPKDQGGPKALRSDPKSKAAAKRKQGSLVPSSNSSNKKRHKKNTETTSKKTKNKTKAIQNQDGPNKDEKGKKKRKGKGC